MKNVALIGMLLLFAGGCAHLKPWPGKPFVVAVDGQPRTQIVVAEKASPSTRYAAEELQRFLKEMTGADLPLVTDAAPMAQHEILVGQNDHFFPANITLNVDKLGAEGYIIRANEKHLVIAGGEPRGTLYGVYGLLEDHLGCRWFMPSVSRIPKSPTLKVREMEETIVPRLEYREPFTKDCFDGDWAARNRMNSNAASLDARHGGKITYFGFVHTFDGLVPPATYFADHPEYFAMVKGQRLQDHTQLCCTNEDVIRIVTEEIRKRMREHPEATVFSVSQNDWGNYCQCDRCAALAKAEDSQIAPVLLLVNKVAAAVRDEFPNKAIDTLAYQWTRKPPKTMRPEPNVIIRLCSIECCFAHPFVKCNSTENKTFVKDVEGWSKISNRLWVWDYVTSFSHYFVPFPNLYLRDDNIRFFADHNVTGIFEQDVYTTFNGELSPLSGYVGAKLLWNPDYDVNQAVDEFLEGVYGAAARPIRRYLALIHNKVKRENIHMDIWIGPEHRHLTNGLLARADALWDEAEAVVANDPAVLERVKVARLSVDYAIIERTRARFDRAYTIDHEGFKVLMAPDFAARVKRFFEVAERNGVTAIRENNGDLGLYKKEIGGMEAAKDCPPHDAAAVTGTAPGLRCRYYEGGWMQLPDFSTLTPVSACVAAKIGLDAVTAPAEAYGLVFTGYIEVPRDGVYTFSLKSNDGSILLLDGEKLVDNDGGHKTEARSGMTGLRAGRHPLEVRYFQAGGNKALELLYAGPGIPLQSVPATALSHTKE